jgi:hypothetical protein
MSASEARIVQIIFQEQECGDAKSEKASHCGLFVVLITKVKPADVRAVVHGVMTVGH